MKKRNTPLRLFNNLPLILLVVFCSAERPVIAQSVADTTVGRNGLAAIPIIYYTPETRWAFGAGGIYIYRQTPQTLLPSTVIVNGIYTQNRQSTIEATSNIYFGDGEWWHQGDFIYQKYPNTFFGVGHGVPDSTKEEYISEGLRINPSLLKKIWNNFYAGFRVHYEAWSLLESAPGKILSRKMVPGSQATTVTETGLIVNYDQRDNFYAPRTGRLYQMIVSASPEFLGSTFGFSSFSIDLREYTNLGDDHLFASRMVMKTTRGTVPFRFLPKLGGQSLLRGYFEGRYMDYHLAALQGEYRSPMTSRFGVVVFGGAGTVSDYIANVQINTLKFSYGAGIRIAFIPEERLNLRIDVGFGKGSSGVYVNLGEAF